MKYLYIGTLGSFLGFVPTKFTLLLHISVKMGIDSMMRLYTVIAPLISHGCGLNIFGCSFVTGGKYEYRENV